MSMYNTCKQIKVDIVDRVGRICLARPGGNSMGLVMMEEIMETMKAFEQDDNVRCVMVTHEGPDFSIGCGEAEREAAEEYNISFEEAGSRFSKIGGELVEYIDQYPKPTLVVGKGLCWGDAAAIYEAFDIRIAGESLHLFDGDVYWGVAANWGMCTLRLPLWLGRNKIMDFVFLNEFYYGRQLYELGIVSKVIADEYVDVVALTLAKKMATTAPVAVAEFKKVVQNLVYSDRYQQLRKFEIESAERVNNTEDTRNAMAAAAKGEVFTDFKGR